MSYLPHRPALGAVIFDKPQRIAMELKPEELSQLDPVTRLEYKMRYHEVKAAKTSAFWDAVGSAVAVIVPVAAVFGVERFFKSRRKKK